MKKAHPLTEFIPEVADYDQMVMDVAQNGLHKKIVVYEDMVIEGRVRQRAAKETGIGLKYRDWVLMETEQKDPLEWMIVQHIRTHEPSELERLNLAAHVLPYFRALPGKTEELMNRATGVSIRKLRVLDWLLDTSAIEPVLRGEKEILQVGREAGLVSEKRGFALGTSFGAGDRFDEAVQPIKRYLSAWKRKGYEFRHVNPKEAQRRLALIESVIEELQTAKADLTKRAVTARYSAPSEKKQ